MFKLGTEVSRTRERTRERDRDRTDAMLRLIHPRFIKLNQRELVKALFSYVRSSTMHHRRGKFQFRGRYFRNSLFRVPTNLHPSPPPYSTDQRRSFDSKILDREFTPSTNWIFPNETMLSFSLSFPLPKESNLWKRRRGRTMKRYLRRIEGERRNDDGLRGRGFDEATLKRTFMRRVEESAHRLTRSQEENRIKHI